MHTDAIMPPTKVIDCPGCKRPMWQEAGKSQCQDCANRAKLAERDRLVNENIGLAKRVAQVMYDKIDRRMDFDTLLSGAYMGLINAATGFDPGMGVRFTTFARVHMDGAMRDEMRQADPVGRNQRVRGRKFENAADAFRVREGRPPTEDELRAELKMSAEQYELERPFAVAPRPTQWGEYGENLKRRLDAKAPKSEGEPDADDWWRAATAGLSRTEKTVVLLHFRDGLPMAQVGRAIGRSESRVSQMVTHIKARLGSSPSVASLNTLHGRSSHWATRLPKKSPRIPANAA